MIEALFISLLLTLGTTTVVAVLALCFFSVCYVLDNWPEFEGLAKTAVFLLLLWAFWFTLVCVNKYYIAPAKAEVENVRAS